MKIIHTSDWHLGQSFHGYDRNDEHGNMIAALRGLIAQEQPDLLVIAGDIYDVAAPGAYVQKQFSGYMLELKQAAPGMPVVCISGNHDSSSRHEIFQEPWEALNVHMIGKVDMENLQNNIISIPGKGWVVAVPYTNERFLDDEFYQRLQEAVKVRAADGLPVVYVGHAAIEKFDFTGHSNMSGRFIGGIECTSLDRLGECYDYIALGHIHKAQSIGRARYCGSPVPVGFDEVRPGYEHGFTVVEIESKGAVPEIEHIPLEMIRPLVNIPSQGHAPWTEVMDELTAFPADIPAYIRLNVLLQDGQILPYDRQKQTDDALEGKMARCVNVNPVRELANLPDSNASATLQLTMDELQKEDPATILRQYAQQKGETFTDEFASMLETVIKNINSTADED